MRLSIAVFFVFQIFFTWLTWHILKIDHAPGWACFLGPWLVWLLYDNRYSTLKGNGRFD